MNRAKFYIIAVLLISIAGCNSTPMKEDQGLTLRKSTPIQLFMGTCVVGRQSPAALEESAKIKGFVSAPAHIAEGYLKGNDGKAWYLSNSTFGVHFTQ